MIDSKNKYVGTDRLLAEIERWRDKAKEKYNESAYSMGRCDALAEFRNYIVSLQQEQPKKRLIQVKCLYPYDESWQKNKVYTCEVWHHGDLNRDFWDVYYDYGKDPKYVQFPTIELLNEEFAIIQEGSQVIPEQPEVDLENYLENYFKGWRT